MTDWEPTMNLRFVVRWRHGIELRILQQQWMRSAWVEANEFHHEYEWRDVETADE